jgi:outer membrane immunogenic protein
VYANLRAKGMKERSMRWMPYTLLIVAMASPALAADYDLPILRGSSQPPASVVTVGPATFTRWSGFYFGGDVSLGSATSDFSNAARPLVQFSLQHTTLEDQVHPSDFQVLGRGSAVAAGGGAFLGYNTQWQNLVLGVEATYTHTNLNTTASSTSVGRIFPSLSTSTTVSGSGNLDLTDFGTARARAGYVVGNLLPYGFIGMAAGRASYSVTSRVFGFQSSANPPFDANGACNTSLPTCSFFDFSNSAGQSNALLWGCTVGAGLDWALTVIAYHCPPRAVCTPRAFRASAISRSVRAPARLMSRMIGSTVAAWRSAAASFATAEAL